MSSANELREQIIQKAWADPEFKERLLANPESAIEDAFGIQIPDGYTLKVLEETDDTYYLVLPQSPAADGELIAASDNVSRWA